MLNTLVRAVWGAVIGSGLGAILGALTSVAYQAGFSVSQLMHPGVLGDAELGAMFGAIPGGAGGCLMGLLANALAPISTPLGGAAMGALVGFLWGLYLGDRLAHFHDTPFGIGTPDYYRSLVYYGCIGAVPGFIGGYL